MGKLPEEKQKYGEMCHTDVHTSKKIDPDSLTEKKSTIAHSQAPSYMSNRLSRHSQKNHLRQTVRSIGNKADNLSRFRNSDHEALSMRSRGSRHAYTKSKHDPTKMRKYSHDF